MSGTTSRDSWIPKMFLAGFLVVIVANATMAGFAFSSWTGIATEDAYRKGLAYNATLHAARAGRGAATQRAGRVRRRGAQERAGARGARGGAT